MGVGGGLKEYTKLKALYNAVTTAGSQCEEALESDNNPA